MGDSPLGPFTYGVNSPFCSRLSGFITAAGHGSTIEDRHGSIQTWWTAQGNHGEWLKVDLGEGCRVHGVQINFAEEGIPVMHMPAEECGLPGAVGGRYIDSGEKLLITTMNAGQSYFYAIDAYNENGVTEGAVNAM